MGTSYCIASGKGGTGKTTITANLGIALAQRGRKVLIVDADIAMANLSLLLGMHSSPITLHDVLLGESSVMDAIYDAPEGTSFMPSGLSFESYRRVDSERLGQVIDSLKDSYDFILLDAPAGIEKNVLAALSAVDCVLLVTMPISPSIADALKTKIVAQRLGAKPTGIIVNFVRGEKGEIAPEDISKMLELPVYGLVPYDDEIRRSFMQEKISPTILTKPNCNGVKAIQAMADKLTGKRVKLDTGVKKPGILGFLNKLFSIFKRKPKEKKIKEAVEKKPSKEVEKEVFEEVPEISEESIEIKG